MIMGLICGWHPRSWTWVMAKLDEISESSTKRRGTASVFRSIISRKIECSYCKGYKLQNKTKHENLCLHHKANCFYWQRKNIWEHCKTLFLWTYDPVLECFREYLIASAAYDHGRDSRMRTPHCCVHPYLEVILEFDEWFVSRAAADIQDGELIVCELSCFNADRSERMYGWSLV